MRLSHCQVKKYESTTTLKGERIEEAIQKGSY